MREIRLDPGMVGTVYIYSMQHVLQVNDADKYAVGMPVRHAVLLGFFALHDDAVLRRLFVESCALSPLLDLYGFQFRRQDN